MIDNRVELKKTLAAERDQWLARMTPQTRELFEKEVLPRLRRGEGAPLLDEVLAVDHVRRPVSIREFISGREYLNLTIGDGGIRPKIVEGLERLFAGAYNNVL